MLLIRERRNPIRKSQMSKKVTVIGAGLAGSEAAWILSELGVEVDLYEMKPIRKSPAHKSDGYA